jgi:hypothetical protein
LKAQREKIAKRNETTREMTGSARRGLVSRTRVNAEWAAFKLEKMRLRFLRGAIRVLKDKMPAGLLPGDVIVNDSLLHLGALLEGLKQYER